MTTYLFTGIETFSWVTSDWQSLIDFAKQYKVDGLIIKVYEFTQGEWYGGNLPVIAKMVTDAGLTFIPYGFHYGTHMQEECDAALKYLATYGIYVADMEGDFDNNAALSVGFTLHMLNHPGVLCVSTWANVADHRWLSNIQTMMQVVQIWMPQAYSDWHYQAMLKQWPMVPNMQPTFCMTCQDLGPNNPAVSVKNFNGDAISLWEYQGAKVNTSLLQEIVGEEAAMPIPNSATSMLANFLPVPEFQPGFTEFSCGPFAVATCAWAVRPDITNVGMKSNEIAWAEKEYAKVNGDNSPSNTAGSSIDDMHVFLKDTQSSSTPQPLHWWDIPTDTANIKAALEHRYLVIATIPEQSVYDLDLQSNPYWWGPFGNHIIVLCGIAPDGNYLAADCANVIEGDGNLQTPKNLQPWPRRYDIGKLIISWAAVIQTAWLPPILNGTPTSWPPLVIGVNKAMEKQALDTWMSTDALLKSAYGDSANITSGIHAAWLKAYMSGQWNFGGPTTLEFDTVDWGNSPVKMQRFDSGYYATYAGDGLTRFYSPQNKQVYVA